MKYILIALFITISIFGSFAWLCYEFFEQKATPNEFGLIIILFLFTTLALPSIVNLSNKE